MYLYTANVGADYANKLSHEHTPTSALVAVIEFKQAIHLLNLTW